MTTRKTLDALYPKLAYNQRCKGCGRQAQEIHHIIRRDNLLLRWDYKNLLPLCRKCHSDIHSKGKWHHGLDLSPYSQYLEERKYKLLSDFLLENDLSESDFLSQKEQELLSRILK